MNGIDNCSIVYAKRVMRLELADLNEMVRLGAGISGDDHRIEIITGLLEQWDMDVPPRKARRRLRGDAGEEFQQFVTQLGQRRDLSVGAAM